MGYVRIPKILSYVYDYLGFVPGTAIQVVLGLGVAGYGLWVLFARKPAADA